jgi:hypothetical protein
VLGNEAQAYNVVSMPLSTVDGLGRVPRGAHSRPVSDSRDISRRVGKEG